MDVDGFRDGIDDNTHLGPASAHHDPYGAAPGFIDGRVQLRPQIDC
jgi:hypothetical protein